MSACGRRVKVPVSSLRLWAPPLRLLSAFLWQVAERRQVKYYTKLDEFVCIVLEIMPNLLSAEERFELLLGLRAKFILEVCHDQPSVTFEMIQPHLERISITAESNVTSTDESEGQTIAVRKFVDLIQTLLRSPTYRMQFFQDVYPLHYGAKYDTALQSLVWEFLSRLERTIPVPSFHQMKIGAPFLEDSLQIIDEPKKVQHLLQHFKHFRNMDQGPSSSAMLANTIFSTISVSSTVITAHSPGGEAEKCLFTAYDTPGVEADKDGDMTEQESCGDTHEHKQRDADEGSHGGEDEYNPQTDTDEGKQRCMNEMHLNDQNQQKNDQKKDDANDDETAGLSKHKSTHLKKRKASQKSVVVTGGKSHQPKNTSASSPPQHICTECEQVFPSKSSLTRHKKIHTTERKGYRKKISSPQPHSKTRSKPLKYTCSECGKDFCWKWALAKHQTIHTGERPHLCSYCGKTFRQKSTLVAHIRVHTGERPYVCSVCGKTFIQSTSLTAHKRLHTGERPFLCSFCGKGFPASGALLVHSRIHTGDLPHKCEFCGKGFRMSCYLAVHRRVHTKEKPYRCVVCEMKFVSHTRLSRHMKIHTGEKPHECLQCGKRFSQKYNLRIHQRVHR